MPVSYYRDVSAASPPGATSISSWGVGPTIKMPLKPDKGVAYLRHAAELGRRVADGPVFQFQQVRQFGLIQLTDAFFDILAEDKIQKRLKLAIVVGKYLVPVGGNPLLPRDGGQGKCYVGKHVIEIAFLSIDHASDFA